MINITKLKAIPAGMVTWVRGVEYAIKETQKAIATLQQQVTKQLPYQAVITAGEYRTSITYPRISIETEGIVQYDSDGNPEATWTRAGIVGATFIGGVIKTNATGARIEIRPDLWATDWEGIRFYDNTKNSGWPEIKVSLAGGSMYLSSGEVDSGVSGNSELHLDPGGGWYLGSTHVAGGDTSMHGLSDASIRMNSGGPLGKRTLFNLGNGFIYLGSTDSTFTFRTGFSLQNNGNDIHLDADAGGIWLSAKGNDLNLNSSKSGATTWLAADGGPVRISAKGDISLSSSGGDVVLTPGSGKNLFAGVGTTSNAANMWMATTGQILRSTSSEKNKADIEDVPDPARVLSLRARRFKSLADADDGRYFIGLVAEEVHDTGLTELVDYDEDDVPAGVQYGQGWVMLLPLVKELWDDYQARQAS